MSALPHGFELEFHGALSEPVTIAGVPRLTAILIGTLGATLSLGLQAPFIGLPLSLFLYAVALWMTKRDPYVFDVLRRHLRQPGRMDG
ncbi:VirB3 family type IV secretion system protein [Caulobacter hibisci]|uniref:VirB3 family type IV secretion system protein n=1 Tax=Caulobacter hibisci TaxID=2035993 RepID=A0ABS0T031_9CAUL|nr:VirB3 family type IV secretion system protein [Caulobacter hibisci]MBI1684202.1 VirB3 family type IV secretion system protein [Caulobacter hibisci]